MFPLGNVTGLSAQRDWANVSTQFKEIAIAYQTLSDPALRLVKFLANESYSLLRLLLQEEIQRVWSQGECTGRWLCAYTRY